MNDKMIEHLTAPLPKQTKQPDRQPIPISRLLLCTANPAGANLPYGNDNKSTKMFAMLESGIHGDVKTTIEHRPWMRMYYVRQTQKVDRDGGTTWKPKGRPYMIPESWAVGELADE